MKPLSQIRKTINEASNYPIYHKSYTSAVDAALAYAKKLGYEYTDDDTFHYIGTGSKRPSEGKTTKVTLPLQKNGKEQKKALHFQVYAMGDKYELNAYVS